MVAEARDLDSGLNASLINGVRAINLNGLAINVNVEKLIQGLARAED